MRTSAVSCSTRSVTSLMVIFTLTGRDELDASVGKMLVSPAVAAIRSSSWAALKPRLPWRY